MFLFFRIMSSKRKNTPTKLAADDALLVHERIEHTSDGDSHIDSDLDSDCSANGSVHMRDSSDEGGRESVSPSTTDRPQSKKERILQSVKSKNENDFGDNDSANIPMINNNNILLTKPQLTSQPLSRKSMDHVLMRLNSSKNDSRSPVQKLMDTEQELTEGIRSVLKSAESAEDQEKKLSDMIEQLQSLKEKVALQKNGRVSRQIGFKLQMMFFTILQ